MKKNMVVTINDYQRLMGLMEFDFLKTKMPDITSRLYNDLMSAKMLPQNSISKNVITMNSRVLIEDMSSGRETELTLTYPKDAENTGRKISVFSPVGIALLGRKVGDVVSWKIPNGTGQFQILKVTYQPEAVGDYTL